MAISVLGAPDYMRTWKATANGLESICALYNDSLLALDEFGQSDAKEIGVIAYMISAGIGKQRASRDGSAKEPRTWRVMLLSTGEVGLEDHMRSNKQKVKAGQLARVIDIPAAVSNGYGCFEDIHGHKDGAEFANAITALKQNSQENSSATQVQLGHLITMVSSLVVANKPATASTTAQSNASQPAASTATTTTTTTTTSAESTQPTTAQTTKA